MNKLRKLSIGWPAMKDIGPLWLFSEPGRSKNVTQQLRILPPRSVFVLRTFNNPGFEKEMKRWREQARSRHIRFLVGKNMELCQRLKADGIHVPSHDLSDHRRIRRLRRSFPQLVFCASIHDEDDLSKAKNCIDWDFLILSPIFPTNSPSKREHISQSKRSHMAWQAGRQAVRGVIALGGVTPSRMIAVRRQSFSGYAGISFQQKK